MCGGNDAPPPPQLQPPPPVKEFMDFFDEISGTATVTGKNAVTGKEERRRYALPKTAEQQEVLDFAGKMVREAIQNITALYRYDPNEAVNYQPFIERISNLNTQSIKELSAVTNLGDINQYVKDFKEMNQHILDRVFDKRFGNLEEGLAHGGQSNSSAAQEARRELIAGEAMARRQADLESEQAGENLAQQRLSRNAQAFGLNEGVRDLHRKEAELAYNLERERVNELERRRTNAIEEQKSIFGLGQRILGDELNKQLQGNTTELSNQAFALENNANLARTQAMNNTLMNQYNMDMAAHNAQPPSFGQTAFQVAAHGIGKMMESPQGSLYNRAGSAMASKFGF